MELNILYRGIIIENGEDYKYFIYPVEENKGVFTCWLMPDLPGRFKKAKLRESEISFSKYPPTAADQFAFSEELNKKGIEFIKKDLFPTTEAAVEDFEKNNDVEKTVVPKSLQNASDILKRGKIEEVAKHQKTEEMPLPKNGNSVCSKLKLVKIEPTKRIPPCSENVKFDGRAIMFYPGSVKKMGLEVGTKIDVFHKEEDIKKIFVKISTDKDNVLILREREKSLVVSCQSVSSFVVNIFGCEKVIFRLGNEVEPGCWEIITSENLFKEK